MRKFMMQLSTVQEINIQAGIIGTRNPTLIEHGYERLLFTNRVLDLVLVFRLQR